MKAKVQVIGNVNVRGLDGTLRASESIAIKGMMEVDSWRNAFESEIQYAKVFLVDYGLRIPERYFNDAAGISDEIRVTIGGFNGVVERGVRDWLVDHCVTEHGYPDSEILNFMVSPTHDITEMRISGYGIKKITAIKWARQLSGYGLKEAKEAVDNAEWFPIADNVDQGVVDEAIEDIRSFGGDVEVMRY